MLRQSGCITTTLLVSLLAQQAPPTIRSRTTLVPIDVRVVDVSGNPITDLKRDDLVIEEDGIRQDIKLFDGEKHLVFINEAGLFLPRLEDDKSLAAMASDARVAIDTIHTGGILTMDPMTNACPACPRQIDPNRV